MAGKGKKTSRSAVANLAVRYLLGVAGQQLGGCSDAARERARSFFDGRCPYSGDQLPEDFVWDHAVPINLEHCGLHVDGNLVPCTRAANDVKHHRHWNDVQGLTKERAARIQEFIASSPYADFAAERTQAIRAVCLRMSDDVAHLLARYADEVRVVLAGDPSGRAGSRAVDVSRPTGESRRQTSDPVREDDEVPRHLSIRYLPSFAEFRRRLLATRRARIVEYFSDGTTSARTWRAERVTEASKLRSVVRTKDRYKAQAWRRNGIVRLEVEAQP